MWELSAAKLREFYVAKRNITLIQVVMLLTVHRYCNMTCGIFLRILLLQFQLMSNIGTILHAIILSEYWESVLYSYLLLVIYKADNVAVLDCIVFFGRLCLDKVVLTNKAHLVYLYIFE